MTVKNKALSEADLLDDAQGDAPSAAPAGGNMEKALPSEDDLLKALDALTSTSNAMESGIPLRQTELASKAAEGMELTKSEKEELSRFLVDDDDDDYMVKSHADVFAANPTVAEGLEISDFLESYNEELCKSLDVMREKQSSEFAEIAQFHGVLAKSISAMGQTIVALKRQLDAATGGARPAQAPAVAAPKGRTSRVGEKLGEDMVKSETGGDDTHAQLASLLGQREQVLNAFDSLLEKSRANEIADLNGIDLVHESTKYETTGIIAPQVLKLVAKERGIQL
jgi:hypothetical protein